MEKRCTFRRMICGIIAIACVMLLGYGIMAGIRHDRTMHAALMQLQADNQADTIFTSDSAARALVRYFDHPWHNANDRLLAYYLLGRAHADMGEAPQAIEDYQTAIERADTTAADCDFRLLRNVYGQMADVFEAENLPEDERKAEMSFSHYSWILKDTTEAILSMQRLDAVYYLLGQYDSIIINAKRVQTAFLRANDSIGAARALIMSAYVHLLQEQYDEASVEIDLIRHKSDIYDSLGNLLPPYQRFNYTIGLYFDGINQLDSAEYYYRQVLAAGDEESGYKGLLSLYGKLNISDSIVKYAPLYADANDAMHRKMNSEVVHKTASLYNYNRHLRQAHYYEQQSNHRLILVLAALCLLLFFILIFYQHYKHTQKMIMEKEKKLLNLHLQLLQVNETLARVQAEAAMRERDLSTFQVQIDDLNQQKELLEEQLLASDDRYKAFHESELVKRFKLMATPVNREYASANDREQLIRLFKSCFPTFAKAVNELKLTPKEWIVIVLTELGFQTGEMFNAAFMKSDSVTYVKRALSKKLFNQDGLTLFHIMLKTAIVTGRLRN